uniref:ABC transporter ATP-binding protein n=1 Tax=Saccharibacillus sp. CPCC 101409 TaxID=3058041 RepID=UPI00267157C4|nr:ATP-binding cassette domain-containing protein [Saccharibacillus sp. CPCC 101409]
MKLLEAVDLTKVYADRASGPFGRSRPGPPAVDGVSLELRRGETLGLIGESGCGKSTLARMLLRLEPPTSGRVLYRGSDITDWKFGRMRRVRSRMQLVFQSSAASFNPSFTVERIVAEPLRNAGVKSAAERRLRILETLESVGLGAAYLDRLPAELSGGQQQRVGIARAIVLRPEILILDEPFSSLDFSLRRQAMELLAGLKEQLGLSYLFITHDLSIVGRFCDRAAVMRRGRIVEQRPGAELMNEASHPYTRMLLDSIPARHPADRTYRLDRTYK